MQFLAGIVLGIVIGVIVCAIYLALFMVGDKEQPVQQYGPRLPHHRITRTRLPEWQECQRDVDHLEAVSKMSRDEAWWTGEKK